MSKLFYIVPDSRKVRYIIHTNAKMKLMINTQMPIAF